MGTWTPDRIRSLRQLMKMTQAAFGDHIGITRTYVYLLEKGVKKPSKTLMCLFDYIEKAFKGKGGV